MCDANDPLISALSKQDASLEEMVNDLISAYESGEESLINHAADRIILFATTLDDGHPSISVMSGGIANQLAAHCFNVGYWFLKEQTVDRSRIVADSVLWIIDNFPFLEMLGQPYCFDLPEVEYGRVAERWRREVQLNNHPSRQALLNAAEFFRERDHLYASDLVDRAEH